MNALLLFLVFAADEQPKPKVPVGKDTTVVTGPLTKEGYIDYEAALNERLGKGIAPEKNANVLLWKALGPRPEGGTRMPEEFFKLLGMTEPPENDTCFMGLQTYTLDLLKLTSVEFDGINKQRDWAMQRPWTANVFPHIANWLAFNEKPLAIVIEASKRPEYFNPLVSSASERVPGRLLAALLPGVQKSRELVQALTARAMLRVSAGQFEGAWNDLIACHRLGRLMGRGGTLIETLVGFAIERMTGAADLAYLESAKLSANQIRTHLKELQSLPAFPPIVDKLNLGERFMYLDCLQMVRRRGFGMVEALAGGRELRKPDADEKKALDLIDWTPAFQNGNLWYDRLIAALRLKDRYERETQFDKFEAEVGALRQRASAEENLSKYLMSLRSKTAVDKTVGKAIGDVLIVLMMPAVRKVNTAAERGEQTQRNLHIAFALAAYRAETGRYPAKLEDLAPKYLPSVPNDLFADKPLIYRPSENGYLLYSVGPNGKDEDGRTNEDEPRGDDLRVRMPLDKPK